jgi:hypothetical protein
MIEKFKRLYTQLFTDEKFPEEERESVGGKKIGDVYDVQYMPSPENPGEMVVVFAKKDEDE